MTEALKLRTFYMLRGMKETCTEATSSRRFLSFENQAQGSPWRKMWKIPKIDPITQTYPCIEMLDERKEQRHFAKRCLLISMTFYEFSKTGVNLNEFSRPAKK